MLRLRRPNPWVLAVAVVLAALAMGLIHGSTAANSVPPSRAGISVVQTAPYQFAPHACGGLNLSGIIYATGGRTRGTAQNDLIIGTSGNDRLDGEEGDDCLVAGGGKNDRLDGGPGYDVCVGNADTQFTNCEVEVR